MTREKSHISEEDFRRYRENQMSGEERNAFEKELQKSSFEADAMEGFEAISPEELKHDLSELRERIIKSERKRTIPYFAAAASILLLITAGVIWIQFGNQESIPEMAQTMKKDETQSSKKGQVVQPIDNTDILRKEKSPSPKNEIPLENQPQSVATKKSEKKQQAVEDTPKASEEEPALTDKNNVTELAGVAPADDSMLYEVGGVRTAAVAADEIVTVSNVEEGEQEVAYNIQVDSKQERIRTFEAVEENADFAEKVMPVAAPLEKKASRTIAIPETKAQPVSGMESFMFYLDSAAVLPATYEKQSVDVKLKIEISQKGKIKNIQNTGKPDSMLLKKAKKILQDGPEWAPKTINGNPVKSEINLIITFRRK
jgi:hypothetical protein